MSRVLHQLFDQNREWAAGVTRDDPEFFTRLADQHAPDYFWIGCCDSRVSPEQIMGLLPGQMSVHRNIANVVALTDLNCLSAIQFAVDVLKVPHIIVCGHYDCRGVLAALRDDNAGLPENWLRHVQDVKWKHAAQLDQLGSEAEQHVRLCELNVVEQVVNVSRTTVVRDAWARGQNLSIHGWIYDLRDGLLHDLDVCITTEEEVAKLAEPARTGGLRQERVA